MNGTVAVLEQGVPKKPGNSPSFLGEGAELVHFQGLCAEEQAGHYTGNTGH